jgi:hypothetical protein
MSAMMDRSWVMWDAAPASCLAVPTVGAQSGFTAWQGRGFLARSKLSAAHSQTALLKWGRRFAGLTVHLSADRSLLGG